MIAEEPTQKLTKRMRKAGWAQVRSEGSHSVWKCSTGQHQVTVPVGHRTISPGVVRKVNKALDGCDC